MDQNDIPPRIDANPFPTSIDDHTIAGETAARFAPPAPESGGSGAGGAGPLSGVGSGSHGEPPAPDLPAAPDLPGGLVPPGKGEQESRNPPPRKGVLGRALARDVPRPPFAGRTLGRAEVEQILAVARENGRQGGIDLRGTDLRDADLSRLNLAGVRLGDDDPLATDSERRDLAAQMDRVNLAGANLAGAIAPGVSFVGANLHAAQLAQANCAGASFAAAHLAEANLSGAQLTDADLTGVNLSGAQLAGAVLVGAHMQKADLRGAHLENADLGLTNLLGADLRHAYCNDQTHLGGAYLRHVAIDGMYLRDLDLTAIDWSPVRRLGDELAADAAASNAQPPAYRVAARVYRRLGLALRGQGMSAEGSRYLARARIMESCALAAEVRERWRSHRYLAALFGFVRWVGATIQGAVTGYGEHPVWVVGWAVVALFLFAALYVINGVQLGTALLASGSALIGRGYVQAPDLLSAPGVIGVLTLVESAVGTILELLFVLALARKTLG